MRRAVGTRGWGFGAALAAVPALALLARAEPASPDFEGPSPYLVDVPTAGLPPDRAIETRGRVFPGGGMELRVEAGILDRASLGVGFGGLQVIGDGTPDWYPRPGFALKARVLEESWTLPAIAVGIDTRGSGVWDRRQNRFQYKSRGVFAVASKNYRFLGDLALHGGASRSFETRDDGDPTLFGGLEKSLGPYAGLTVEYDLATNDNARDGVYGRGRGYLNASIRLRPAPRVELRIMVRDMLDNTELDDPGRSDVVVDDGWGREVALTYMATPF